MSNFWDLMWLIFSAFVFVAYLVVLFQIVVDLFRDAELGGVAKAAWIVGLLVLPVLTALALRDRARPGHGAGASGPRCNRYGRKRRRSFAHMAGKSPVEQIADAKAMLDAGTISADEFAKLKAKALA